MGSLLQEFLHNRFSMPITLVLALGLLATLGPLSVDMYLPGLPEIGRDLGTDESAVQLTLSAYFAGFCLSMLVYGPLSDRTGRKPVILTGLAIFTVAGAYCAYVEGIDLLIAGRFLQAVGGGAGAVVARAIIRDISSGDRAASAMSTLMASVALAAILAPVAGGFVIEFSGWRTVFLILSGFGVLSFLTVLALVPETLQPERRQSGGIGRVVRGYGEILADRRAITFILAGAAAYGGLFAYISGSPYIFIDLFGFSPREYGLLFALNAIGIGICSLANQRLVWRIGYRRLLTIGCAVMAAAGAALLATASMEIGGMLGIAVPLFVFISMMGLVGSDAVAGALDHHPARAGSTSALYGAIQFGMGAVGGTLVGQFYDGTPVPLAMVMCAAGILSLLAERAAPDARRSTTIAPGV
ncbi:MAG: Bcr/CflA family multidrug efflux MFS transporter [Alphaproteobacteria bacterium]|nr:Bcr/CflA family multidrug efflux MFS transporter [Alphaproteobacteria bacterium]MDX5369589.1 Bcr/CflA family multidrug efflux MFS transporter [Alphaproteobacteria bacterium]MDX5464243.1 Bcr/CflA family multidrug efflux MFS transporter [Alphaproteobacteria bacterium]